MIEDQIQEVHLNLKNLYNIKDYNGAKLFLKGLYYTNELNLLMIALLISKSFKENPILSEILLKILNKLETKLGKKLQ